MALTNGARLGPYEILEPVGAGGMGEVYRARDVRLNRDVAVKTVSGPFTERFEREAQAISSLNHPHICTLYDVGEHEGSGYLVMEYIEGKPVAGPLPVEQAVAYGIEICEALHAAHRKGIVHRDLKPANVMVTKQGIKLLDFGLAKLASAGTPGSGDTPTEQATVAALTGAHTVVGTPQYMAPEQIEGREVDARTDIFAFGCVLYELLTGKRAFEGKTASSVMAAVLATAPRPLEELVPLTPPALDRIVSRCLAKDPEDRWQTARDVMAELQWVAQGGSRAGLPAIVTVRRRTREKLAWAAFAVATLAAAWFAVAWAQRAPKPPPLVRFALPAPDGLANLSPPEVSPDGRNVAFAATDADGKQLIWIRPLDALEAHPLAGTDGVLRPFWSPDSKALAFVAGGKLKKVDIAGGPPQTICDAPTGADGSWSQEGAILFDGRGSDPIWRVSAAGGVAKPEVEGDPAKGYPGWPVFLPDGHHYLFSLASASGGEQTVMVGSLDSKETTTLFKTNSRVGYAEPGYLLFVRENTLVAQKFDPASVALEGEAVPIGEGLGVNSVGLASFSVSRTGILAYRAGDVQGRRLLWFDRSGKATPAIEESGDYGDTSFSPDLKRLVFNAQANASASDIWIRDLDRGVSSRFTFDPAVERYPVWSPDGREIVYLSNAKGPGDLYIKDASGTKEAEPLLETPDLKIASDWSRDGAYLLFTDQSTDTGWDIWALPMKGDRKPFPVVKTKFTELFATFSPDGRYIAYASNESGRSEIYVQEFPEARSKIQVSTSGGTTPFWRADGRELFYRNGARVMSVPVQTGGTFSLGTPVELFQAPFASVTLRAHYRPTPDGQRFLVVASLGREAVHPASIVLNWTAALKN
jgi:eukaryotic-like serine/threonine-protein kinase